jgi:hypothetical protein
MSERNPMSVIAIEEHWTTTGITRALQQQHAGRRDESVVLNDRGDIQARLEEIGEGRIEAMDAADPVTDLALATFGWGWHVEAGIAALRLILRGTFDRHPELQIVLGHWGEMLLFALDRIDSLSNVATHLDRRVAEYMPDNVHIATSGMLTPHLLRHALDFTSIDRILLSGDYPFHRLDSDEISAFLGTLPDPDDRQKIAHRNAQALFNRETLTATKDQERS